MELSLVAVLDVVVEEDASDGDAVVAGDGDDGRLVDVAVEFVAVHLEGTSEGDEELAVKGGDACLTNRARGGLVGAFAVGLDVELAVLSLKKN